MDSTERYQLTQRVEIPDYAEYGPVRGNQFAANMVERDRYNTHYLFINRLTEATGPSQAGHQLTGAPMPYTHLINEPKNFPELFNSEYKSAFVNTQPFGQIPAPAFLNNTVSRWKGPVPFWQY